VLAIVLLALTIGAPEDFARRIVAALQPGEAVQLSVRNLSSAPAGDFTAARQTIQAALRGRGSASEAAAVRVTLSENAEGYLWVAEIVRAGKREAVIVERARAGPRTADPSPVVIEKKPLWEQEGPILDIALRGSELVVLEPAGVSFYRQEDGRWTRVKQTPVQVSKPWPRDPRGRLAFKDGEAVAFLPGGEPDAEWPLDIAGATLAAGRNFFSAPGLPPFFSAARIGDRVLLAGVDGRARFYDTALQPVADLGGWGSDVASIDSKCVRGPLVLATKPGQADDPDAIQAFEIVDRQAIAVSAPVEFLGPVTALRQSAEDGGAAVAISRNLKTGRYAAFSLSISCSR
jgi:hypothetical protein